MTLGTDIDEQTIGMALQQQTLRNQRAQTDIQRRAQNAAADQRRWDRNARADDEWAFILEMKRRRESREAAALAAAAPVKP